MERAALPGTHLCRTEQTEKVTAENAENAEKEHKHRRVALRRVRLAVQGVGQS